VDSSELKVKNDGFEDENSDANGVVNTGVKISDSNEKIDEEIDREDATNDSKEKANEFVDLEPA